MKARIQRKLARKTEPEIHELTLGAWYADDSYDPSDPYYNALIGLTRYPDWTPRRCRGCGIVFYSRQTRGHLCEECRFRGLHQAENIRRETEGLEFRDRWDKAEARLTCRFCGWEDRRIRPTDEFQFRRVLQTWAVRLAQHQRRHELRRGLGLEPCQPPASLGR